MSEQVRDLYERAGFGGRLRPGARPAVLVVDFSRGFTDATSPVGSDMTAEVQKTRALLDRARDKSLPIVFTSIAFEPSLKDGGVWLQKVPTLAQLKAGSLRVEIDPRLGRRNDELILYKRGASAFFGTPLASLLAAERVDTVIVTGATTSGCVRASVVDSMQCGYPTFVIRECVADRAQGPHAANLFDMESKYADVISLDDGFAYLDGLPAPAATLASAC